MTDQLQFSFKLDSEHISIGQDIFFTATFTNTTDQQIILREPNQDRVFEQEDFDTTVLFLVEPVSKDLSILYPGQGFVDRIPQAVLPHEFVTLLPYSSHEIRLKLPHMVHVKYSPATIFSAEYFPLPVGQYRVQLIYVNDVIGYEVEAGYVDLNAWVGRVEANPVILTITSGE